MTPPTSPTHSIPAKSIDVARPCTPDNTNFILHDPDSPCMIALPSTPSRTTINVKPSLGDLHSSPLAHNPASPPFDHHRRQQSQSARHDRQGSKDNDDISIILKPGHTFYDGTRSAASSSTAFESGILHHSSETYLIIDPRNDPRLFGQTHKEVSLDGHTGAGKRKKVDFNKPLKFWLIFVSLCFSCLLSALDLVSTVDSAQSRALAPFPLIRP